VNIENKLVSVTGQCFLLNGWLWWLQSSRGVISSRGNNCYGGEAVPIHKQNSRVVDKQQDTDYSARPSSQPMKQVIYFTVSKITHLVSWKN